MDPLPSQINSKTEFERHLTDTIKNTPKGKTKKIKSFGAWLRVNYPQGFDQLYKDWLKNKKS